MAECKEILVSESNHPSRENLYVEMVASQEPLVCESIHSSSENIYIDPDQFQRQREMHVYSNCGAEQIETPNFELDREKTDKKKSNTPGTTLKKILIPFVIALVFGLTILTVLFNLHSKTEKDQQHILQQKMEDMQENPQEVQRKWTDQQHIPQQQMVDLQGNPQEVQRKWTGSRGRSFLVSFIQISVKSKKSNRTILVLSENDFNITVTLSKNMNSNLISISTERSENITLKKINVHYRMVPSYSSVEDKAILINTSSLTSVLSMNDIDFNSDSTTVFPVDKLSTHYIISTSTPTVEHYLSLGSHFTIASKTDNTRISITLVIDRDAMISFHGSKYGNGDEITIILNMYQTFQVGLEADLSGTTINASHSVAIFAGNACNKLGGYGSCSMLMEMVPPTDKLDNIFIVPSNIYRHKSQVRIISPIETVVQYSIEGSKTQAIVSKNQKIDFIIRENETATIESIEPLLINSFAYASAQHDLYGDPFMITIPGIHQYINEYNLIVPGNFKFSFATFIIKANSLEYLTINGTNANENNTCHFSMISVDKSLYSVWTLSIPSGVMKVRTTDGTPFGVIIYGQRDNDGHGYTGNAISSTCKKGWIHLEYSCYFISPKRVTFEDALKACKDKRASLTEHQNTRIEKVVGLQLREERDVGIWIAVTDNQQEGVYLYDSDGSRVINDNWAKGQPHEGKHYNCAAARKDESWKWFAYPCTHTFYYVCKKPI